AIDLADHIARHEAGFFRAAIRRDARHHHAVGLALDPELLGHVSIEIPHSHASEGIVCLTGLCLSDCGGLRLFSNRDREILFVTVTDHSDRHLRADCSPRHHPLQGHRVFYGRALIRHDDITLLNTGLIRRAVFLHVADECPLGVFGAERLREILIEILNADPEETPYDLPIFDEAFIDRLAHASRHCKTYPLIATGLREDRGVDTYQLTSRIDQCSSGVARIDRRIGLNEVFILR